MMWSLVIVSVEIKIGFALDQGFESNNTSGCLVFR
jgi:hypothetical protein